MREFQKKVVASLITLTCLLYALSGCVSRSTHRIDSLEKPWVKKGEDLIHPDKTIIRLEKPRSHTGRLTATIKDDFYEAITAAELLASWGIDDRSAVVTRFSKKWEPRHSRGRLHKLTMEIDYYCFSSEMGYRAGGKVTTKRIIIYRYMGANVTNRMGVGIMGYSDCVLAHAQEFIDLVDSMSF